MNYEQIQKAKTKGIRRFLAMCAKCKKIDYMIPAQMVCDECLKKESEAGDVEACIKCGCTDEDCSQCIADQDEPCYWVSSGKCSRCFDECGNPKKNEGGSK